MAVGVSATKLHLSSFARRPTLRQVAAIAALCSLSSVTCGSPTPTVFKRGGGGGSSPPLDFRAQHTAEGMEAVSAPAQRVYEACPAKYSEYTPCEDVEQSLRFPRDRLMYRERHCPSEGERLRCLVPAPKGYRNPFPWPASGNAW